MKHSSQYPKSYLSLLMNPLAVILSYSPLSNCFLQMSCSEKVFKSPYNQYLAVHIGKGIYAYRKDFSLSWVSQFFPPPSTLPFQTASTKYCSGPNHDECFKWNSSKEKKLVFLTWVSFPLMKFARSELPKRKWYLLLNIQKLIFLPWW